MTWTLCSKEDVASIHPISNLADLKDEWSDMVEGLIRQYLGQPYLGTTQAITNEWHDGDGKHIINVRKPPIYSVQAIKVNGLALTHADYVVFPNYIELRYSVFPQGILNVGLDYTSGTAEVSDVVRLCAASMIVAIVNYKKRWGADASLKWGEPEKKLGEDTPNYNVGLTSHLTQIMKRLLRRTSVRVR